MVPTLPRDGDETLKAILTRLGVASDAPISSEKAQAAIDALAIEAEDMFESRAAAAHWLETEDFDGRTAYQMVAAGRTGTVLARLDALRFGSTG
ncbi:hypothetical protein IP88_12630 [alpha proteobacterium AAP81b]|nr:hypothetical protein IP88_12630 [alpha proteobacterium AAP81b]